MQCCVQASPHSEVVGTRKNRRPSVSLLRTHSFLRLLHLRASYAGYVQAALWCYCHIASFLYYSTHLEKVVNGLFFLRKMTNFRKTSDCKYKD